MFKVMISGTVESTHETRESAEKRLEEIKNSIFAMVHPIDTMFIKEA